MAYREQCRYGRVGTGRATCYRSVAARAACVRRVSVPAIQSMQCKSCGEDAEELISVTVDGKKRRLCEACADQAKAEDAIAEESEAVVQKMMDFKGRR